MQSVCEEVSASGNDTDDPVKAEGPAATGGSAPTCRPDVHSNAALREAVERVVAAAPDGLYVDCVFTSGDRARWILSLLSSRGRLRSFALDGAALQAAKRVQDDDPRFEVFARPLGELQAVLQEPVHGVFFDMAALTAGPGSTDHGMPATGDGPLGTCLHWYSGCEISVSDWLQSVSGVELAWVIDRFGVMYDPFLSERIAEGIVLQQQKRGAYTSIGQLADVLEEFRPEFELERPNLCVGWIVRAIHVFLSQAPARLREVLEQAFERLETGGQCVVASVSKWEMEAVRRFVHEHEEPGPRLRELLPPERLAGLYPLLSRGGRFAVGLAAQPLQCAQRALLHVLVREPRRGSGGRAPPAPPAPAPAPAPAPGLRPPVAPAFGAAGGAEAGGGRGEEEEEGRWSEAELEELRELKRLVLERKAQLRSEGLSLSQQRRDRHLSEWVARVNKLHNRGPRYHERLRARCRNHPHVPVLLEEAVEAVMALGPDELYVDCTFGRGGHSKLLLSRLSERGRLKAFDVDEVAMEVARDLACADGRLEALHRPFGELSAAVEGPVAGVLLDAGASTPQLEDTSRGFNFRDKKDGPLDLRMDQGAGLPASLWLQTVSAAELAWVIYNCGHSLDQLLSQRVAEGILACQQQQGPYQTTRQLAEAVEGLMPDFSYAYPRLSLPQIVFAALRIFLNREMEQLELAMEGALEHLAPRGRLVLITFNKWEPVAVRGLLRRREAPGPRALAALAALAPARLAELYPALRGGRALLCRARAPRRPAPGEVSANGRSRSALLHVLEAAPPAAPPAAAPPPPGGGGASGAAARLREPAPPRLGPR